MVFFSQDAHDHHRCHERLCPVTCQLCRRLCSTQDHLHGLEDGAVHLCGLVTLSSLCCYSHLNICEDNSIPAMLPVMRMESVRLKLPPIPSRRLLQGRTRHSNTPRWERAFHPASHSMLTVLKVYTRSVDMKLYPSWRSLTSTSVAKRLPCAVPISPGDISHSGPHKHSEEQDAFHFCTTRFVIF